MNEVEKHQLADLLRRLRLGSVSEPFEPPLPGPDYYAPRIDIFVEDLTPSTFKSNLERRTGRPIHSVAIECQGSGSRKHRLGDVVNASLHGDVGVVVCDDEGHRETCARIARYLQHHRVLQGQELPLILTKVELKELLGSGWENG
jgi:hypothetical protein